MKLKNSYFFTKREDSKDEESISANLLVRSGMIKKAGSGIYYFLPMGYRVTKKIEKIVREEMKEIIENHPGFIIADWCGDEACEVSLKEIGGLKSRCI